MLSMAIPAEFGCCAGVEEYDGRGDACWCETKPCETNRFVASRTRMTNVDSSILMVAAGVAACHWKVKVSIDWRF
jgi:hypothetical protein